MLRLLPLPAAPTGQLDRVQLRFVVHRLTHSLKGAVLIRVACSSQDGNLLPV